VPRITALRDSDHAKVSGASSPYTPHLAMPNTGRSVPFAADMQTGRCSRRSRRLPSYCHLDQPAERHRNAVDVGLALHAVRSVVQRRQTISGPSAKSSGCKPSQVPWDDGRSNWIDDEDAWAAMVSSLQRP